MKFSDKDMPHGWHSIKSVLIGEIAASSNFHQCVAAANALFHARLIGESIAAESKVHIESGAAEDSGTGAG